MEKTKAYRHGEIALIKIKKLPEGLVKSDSKILMVGSHGNNHSFDNGTFYPKKDGNFIFGYLEAKETKLQHFDHGNICSVCGYDNLVDTIDTCPKCNTNFLKEKKFRLAKIEDGFCQCVKQNEHTPQGLSPVID